MSELILGTAQFGTTYGVTNSVGRVSDEGLAEIISQISSVGISLIDTAPSYGDAQERLGAHSANASFSQYVTKFSLPDDVRIEPTWDGMAASSMVALNTNQLFGLLFHHTADLADVRIDRTLEIMRAAKSSGLVKHIGVSIYDRDDLDLAVEQFPDLDLLQIPGNLVDRRLLDDDLLGALRARGVVVHVRSAFLQGLLLSRPESLPSRFSALEPVLQLLGNAAEERGVNPIDLCLGFLKFHPNADGVVVGVTTADELTRIGVSWNQMASRPGFDIPLTLPLDVIDPRRWT